MFDKEDFQNMNLGPLFFVCLPWEYEEEKKFFKKKSAKRDIFYKFV